MTKPHAPLAGPLIAALVAVAFCAWTAQGNEVNICVTTGCALYHDASIGGLSLWWLGALAFAALAICAGIGAAATGRFLAALFLACDICLLALMMVTAPCVSCLVVALLFAISYWLFRRRSPAPKRQNPAQPLRPSPLLWIWLVLFIVNLGQVARSQADVWPMLDESGEAHLRMFFSPSCAICVEGVNALSGNVATAFYPVAESDADVARIARMMALISEGESIAEALAASKDAKFDGLWQAWNPGALYLRFRLLRNKAHIFAQGSQGVPFFERKGLPPDLIAKRSQPQARLEPARPALAPVQGGDPNLPQELLEGGQCGGVVPCPPAQ